MSIKFQKKVRYTIIENYFQPGDFVKFSSAVVLWSSNDNYTVLNAHEEVLLIAVPNSSSNENKSLVMTMNGRIGLALLESNDEVIRFTEPEASLRPSSGHS